VDTTFTPGLMVEHDHDEAEFFLVVTRPTTKSSSSAEHDEDGLSPLLANLSIGYMDYYLN
jgi:hypothetical protein